MVMGATMLRLRQSMIAINKWIKLLVAHQLIFLGFIWNTQGMTVGIPDDYLREGLDLLTTTWRDGRCSFTIKEIEDFLGKLGRIAQAY